MDSERMDSERMAELADRLDIRELLDRYSHAVDFMDWPLLETVFAAEWRARWIAPSPGRPFPLPRRSRRAVAAEPH